MSKILTKLAAAGAAVDVKSKGTMLVIRKGARTFYYWPGTKRWNERLRSRVALTMDVTSKQEGTGLDTLLATLNEAAAA